MTSVGSYEARTHLPELLERVARREKLLITRHGRALAMLVTTKSIAKQDVRAAIQSMRELRKGVTLGPGLSIRQLIEEGRRF